MVNYQPIAELVEQISADTWQILQEIQKRRPAMMLDELLDKRERAPKQPPNAQVRKDRKWTGGVDDPQPDRHAGKIAIHSEFHVGCAPDLDFGCHAGRRSGEPLSTVNCPTLTPPRFGAKRWIQHRDWKTSEKLSGVQSCTFFPRNSP